MVMLGGAFYGVHLLKRMYDRFHALAPDDLDLRPSLPFVQAVHGKDDVEDVSVAKMISNKFRSKSKDGGAGGQKDRLLPGGSDSSSLSSSSSSAASRQSHIMAHRNTILGTGTSPSSPGVLSPAVAGDDFMSKLRRFSVSAGLTPEQVAANVGKDGKSGGGGDDGDDDNDGHGGAEEAHSIPQSFHGYLMKKANMKDGSKMSMMRVDPWKSRWFVLEKGRLFYYSTESDWKNGKPPKNDGHPIVLGAFEVMVNPKDLEWGFMLQSVAGDERNWEFRAEGETMRLAWVKCMLKASLVGGSDKESKQVTDMQKHPNDDAQ